MNQENGLRANIFRFNSYNQTIEKTEKTNVDFSVDTTICDTENDDEIIFVESRKPTEQYAQKPSPLSTLPSNNNNNNSQTSFIFNKTNEISNQNQNLTCTTNSNLKHTKIRNKKRIGKNFNQNQQIIQSDFYYDDNFSSDTNLAQTNYTSFNAVLNNAFTKLNQDQQPKTTQSVAPENSNDEKSKDFNDYEDDVIELFTIKNISNPFAKNTYFDDDQVIDQQEVLKRWKIKKLSDPNVNQSVSNHKQRLKQTVPNVQFCFKPGIFLKDEIEEKSPHLDIQNIQNSAVDVQEKLRNDEFALKEKLRCLEMREDELRRNYDQKFKESLNNLKKFMLIKCFLLNKISSQFMRKKQRKFSKQIV